MKYSIIIATYNRLDELGELFGSIAEMEFEPSEYEVIIADDGSTDGTREYIEDSDFPFQLQYLYQENQGPGAARNLAMSKAKGEYFIFIDSDVLLPKDYLDCIDRHLSHNELDAFGGPDDSHPSFSSFLKAVNYSMTSFLGTGGTRGKAKSVARFYPRSFNMGIHRRVYNKIGGMGSLRHGQDMDYSARIYAANFKVSLIPDAVVYHKRRTSLWRFFKQIFNWGVARINLGRQYPDMLKFVHLMPAIVVGGTIMIVGTAPFFALSRQFLTIILIIAALIAMTAFLQSLWLNRNLKVAILSIITLFTQVIAYGLGLLYASFQILMGKEKAQGIVKNYYK